MPDIIQLSALNARLVDWLTPLFVPEHQGTEDDPDGEAGIETDDEDSLVPSRIVVRSVSMQGRSSPPLDTIRIPAIWDANIVGRLAHRIELAVRGDAEAVGNAQLYEALAMLDDGGVSTPFSRLAIRVASEEKTTDNAEKTLAGVVGQLLDNNRELLSLVTFSLGGVIGTLQAQLERQEAQVSTADEARLKYLAASERALSEVHERQIREVEAGARIKQQADFVEFLLHRFPALLTAYKSGVPLNKVNLAEGFAKPASPAKKAPSAGTAKAATSSTAPTDGKPPLASMREPQSAPAAGAQSSPENVPGNDAASGSQEPGDKLASAFADLMGSFDLQQMQELGQLLRPDQQNVLREMMLLFDPNGGGNEVSGDANDDAPARSDDGPASDDVDGEAAS